MKCSGVGRLKAWPPLHAFGSRLPSIPAFFFFFFYFALSNLRSLACVGRGGDRPCYEVLDGVRGVFDQLPEAAVSPRGG